MEHSAKKETAETEPQSSPGRKLALLVGGAVALVLALVFGIPYFFYATSHQGTDDAKIDADVVTVTSKISERVAKILVDTNQPVHKGQLLVLLDSRDERTRYDQAWSAYRSQKAQADAAQATVALTRDQQNAQNQQNQGIIAQAQSGITGAALQTTSQEQQVAVAQAGLGAALAQLHAAQDAVPSAWENLRKAAADLHRDTALVASGDVAAAQLDATRASYAAARSDYQQSLANVAAAQANYAQAQQKVDAQRSFTDSSAAQIAIQRGQLTTARGKLAESAAPSRLTAQEAQVAAAVAQANSALAQVKTAADQLSYTRIVSPIDGYVGEKDVEVGQTVAPGLSLLDLVPAKRIYVTAKYKETQIGKMRVGQPVDIKIDAYPGVKFHGHLEALSPASENTFSLVPAQNATANFVKVTQRVPVRIVFDDPDPKYPLRPGMSVETFVNVKG
jgi:membrane fusion protein, multidrug efflux system